MTTTTSEDKAAAASTAGTTGDRPASASAERKGAGRDFIDGGDQAGFVSAASQKAAEAYQAARERTAAAYAAARERAGSAYETAGRKTSEGIDSNPVAAVVGGLAVGAIVAALLPKTRREEELFGPVGRRLGDTAREAARAAREAGREQIEELGLNKDGLHRRLDKFTDRAVGGSGGSAGGAGDG
jgi:hypothetical protein